jgi:hypothetical protein
MIAPSFVASLCAEQGGFLEGKGRTGSWWKGGHQMVSWRWNRKTQTWIINCTPALSNDSHSHQNPE